jgi:hypothetical protein
VINVKEMALDELKYSQIVLVGTDVMWNIKFCVVLTVASENVE